MRVKELLSLWKDEKDKKGRSLLERARESLIEGSLYKYNATEHSCECPYHTKTGRICKHMVAVFILKNRSELEKNPEWRKFFRLYDKKLEKDIEEVFSCF